MVSLLESFCNKTEESATGLLGRKFSSDFGNFLEGLVAITFRSPSPIIDGGKISHIAAKIS